MRPCTDHDFRLLLFTPRILRGTIHIPRTRSVKSPTRPLWPADGDYPLSCECSPWCLSLLAISHDDRDCWEPLSMRISRYPSITSRSSSSPVFWPTHQGNDSVVHLPKVNTMEHISTHYGETTTSDEARSDACGNQQKSMIHTLFPTSQGFPPSGGASDYII